MYSTEYESANASGYAWEYRSLYATACESASQSEFLSVFE